MVPLIVNGGVELLGASGDDTIFAALNATTAGARALGVAVLMSSQALSPLVAFWMLLSTFLVVLDRTIAFTFTAAALQASWWWF